MTTVLPRSVSRALLALVLAGLAGACAAPAPAGFTDEDRAQLAANAEAATTAANSGDFTPWLNLYAADAVMLPPNSEPVTGAAAIAETMKSFPPLSNVKFAQVTVEGTADMAWVQGTYEMTMTPPGAAPISDRGKFIEIWKKQADGSWKIIRDIYNTSVPLPAPAAP